MGHSTHCGHRTPSGKILVEEERTLKGGDCQTKSSLGFFLQNIKVSAGKPPTEERRRRDKEVMKNPPGLRKKDWQKGKNRKEFRHERKVQC